MYGGSRHGLLSSLYGYEGIASFMTGPIYNVTIFYFNLVTANVMYWRPVMAVPNVWMNDASTD